MVNMPATLSKFTVLLTREQNQEVRFATLSLYNTSWKLWIDTQFGTILKKSFLCIYFTCSTVSFIDLECLQTYTGCTIDVVFRLLFHLNPRKKFISFTVVVFISKSMGNGMFLVNYEWTMIWTINENHFWISRKKISCS